MKCFYLNNEVHKWIHSFSKLKTMSCKVDRLQTIGATSLNKNLEGFHFQIQLFFPSIIRYNIINATYSKKGLNMREHVQSDNRRFLSRDRLFRENNPPEGANSRVDYFLWLNDRMVRINPANAIANIKDSTTVIKPHPLSVWGCADHR